MLHYVTSVFLIYDNMQQLESPVVSLSWSPGRPALLAAAAPREVLLFDCCAGQAGPVVRVSHTPRRNLNIPLAAVAFPNR